MTAIVGILCTDGVVIGSDDSATFATAGRQPTIEQPYPDKVQVINKDIIVATTGQVGLAQRFEQVVETVSKAKDRDSISYADIANRITAATITDFRATFVERLELSAFAAYVAADLPWLCEFSTVAQFQPEFKKRYGLWFVTAGNCQAITDSFLGFLRRIFWPKDAPNLQEGIFAALWTLQHVCDLNPGGIKEPIHIAVLDRDPATNKYRPRRLDEKQLAEQLDMVKAATDYFGKYRQILTGEGAAQIPNPGA